MSDLSSSELERTARAYEKLLVPALFRAWADQMVSVADLQSDDEILDVACGTGVLSRAVKRHLGPGGSVTGLDLNSGMLAVAREQAGDIVWREGNAEALPFNDHSFDAVMSQFGLMLFESPAQALREMWRVLRPGGQLLVAVFDSLDQVPAYANAANVYEQVVGSSVGNALRFPFSMGDPDELRVLFERAGIPEPTVKTRRGSARFD
ncbi:MAG: methyltransferase domain-containing protein, partial [Rhodothermia bacterium]|nr:methyltransferase domain-containing protein [Rhodothermia bacterium]